VGRILWIQGFPDQAVAPAGEMPGGAHSQLIIHCHSIWPLTCIGTVALWTGDVPEAQRFVAMLLDHSSRHSLTYWQFWGRCLEVALARRKGEMQVNPTVLYDPLCRPIHQESLATLHEGLATKEAIARAENGLAGWCAAELLRVKAETLLRIGDRQRRHCTRTVPTITGHGRASRVRSRGNYERRPALQASGISSAGLARRMIFWQRCTADLQRASRTRLTVTAL